MTLFTIARFLIIVFLMTLPFSKVFGMSSMPNNVMGATRHVDFSGNIFSFSMPENFSADMPAEPLIERRDLEKLDGTSVLIQRWWDIKSTGFFKKSLGAVMMSINVQPVPENTKNIAHNKTYDLTNRLDLMFCIDEVLTARYNGKKASPKTFSYEMPSIASLVGNRLSTSYRDHTYNGQKWTGYSVAGPENQLIVGYMLPLDAETLLEVSFIYSPNTNVAPRQFLESAYQITAPIQESFKLEYTKNNPAKLRVEKEWLQQTTDEVLQPQKEALVLKLFGTKVHSQIFLEHKKTSNH